jgi:NAD(P)-dependent dehydrogenase (short-subunit alcohol dehydrogenase family)
MERKKAFVTGASRGIGKAIALRLAQGGFDVAITARTVNEGEAREHSSTLKMSDTSPLPGSLNGTAEIVRAAGAEVLALPADLLDRASLGAAAARALDHWGHVDLVVHNGRYIGPGHMDPLIDTPVEVLERHLQGNAVAHLVLNRFFLPAMIARGQGTFITLTSLAAYMVPNNPIGAGGWGLCYGLSKAAAHMIPGFIAHEHGKDGIRAFNLQPGYIQTERMEQDMRKFGMSADGGAPAYVPAEAAYWLSTAAEAAALNGQTIQAQELVKARNLLPEWAGPDPATMAF